MIDPVVEVRRPWASKVSRSFSPFWVMLMAHPFVLVAKLLFWIINIAAGGAHLQGAENGLERLFPSLSPTELPKAAIPFKIGDAGAHITVSILGSNEMIEGVARTFEDGNSFWHKKASWAQKVIFSLLTLFLVTTAEVSSTYRNWQNNDGMELSMRIFWVSFYLASHIPEVVYSTMLMVRDYFNGPRIPQSLEGMIKEVVVAEITRFQESGFSFSSINSAAVVEEDGDFHPSHKLSSDSISSSLTESPLIWTLEQLDSPACLERVKKIDTYIRWVSRVFGILFVLPTYVVKGMSSVDGFMVITGQSTVLSWILGLSGMFAEAYLEYAFTQGLVGEIATIICYRLNHFNRSTIGDPFYAHLPKTTILLVVFGLFLGFLSVPGSYNSPFGVLPDSWNAVKIAICWLYALRYILQAALGFKLLLRGTIEHLLCYWNPAYGALIKSIEEKVDRILRSNPTQISDISWLRHCGFLTHTFEYCSEITIFG